MLSVIPAPHESFKRNPAGIDRHGGGAVIPCNYNLACYESTYRKVVSLFKELKRLRILKKLTHVPFELTCE